VLVRPAGGEVTGWGEAAPGTWPLFCGEWGQSTFALVRDCILPRPAGATVDDAAQPAELFAEIRENTFAKAAVETAWWALRGGVEQRPLSSYVGGTHQTVRAGADFDIHAGTARTNTRAAPGTPYRKAQSDRNEASGFFLPPGSCTRSSGSCTANRSPAPPHQP
jgi:L-alanine-DL-glutamate epimerase-like enolase superfamily enzyme